MQTNSSEIITILERIERKIDHIDERLRRSEIKQVQLDSEMVDCKAVVLATKNLLNNSNPPSTVAKQIPESILKIPIKTAEKRLKLPCKTIDELDFVENEIRDNIGAYNCIYQYLQRFRVNDHSKFIRRCLHHIFDDSLATSFNWSGKGEKNRRAASELQIIRVLKDVVLGIFGENLSYSSENTITRWFRYADQRLKSKSKTRLNIKNI